jgi:hypothetical protein
MPTHYIVTPVRNAVQTIDATIWSIVSQTGNLDIHYHVQDGGSTDGTLEKISSWIDRIEGTSELLPARVRFTWASEPDHGMYDAINKGFARMAIHPDAFMSWCNADDALWPGALDAVARLGRDLPSVDWVMGWHAWFDELSRFTAIERSPRFPQAILAAGLADGIHWPFVQQESTFWRNRLWGKAGGLDSSFRLAGDWDLWTRFARLTPLTHVHRQLGAFYIRPGQQSSDMETYRSEMNRVLPLHSRRTGLRGSMRHGASLTTVPWAIEGADKRWQLASRDCKPKAQFIAQVMTRLPTWSSAAVNFLYKYLYKYW